MRRLAFTHEAFVSASPNRANRASAAFVSGAAHHISLLSNVYNSNDLFSHLNSDSISPEVSASLLFLIAESIADAAEMAKSIRISPINVVEATLLIAVKYLATGQLVKILNLAIPTDRQITVASNTGRVADVLYFLLFHGIRAIA